MDATTKHRTGGLANTGPAIPLPQALAVGLGALAVGTAATVAGRRPPAAAPSASAAVPPAPVEQRRSRPRPTHRD